jgi:hypothetical protein
MESGKYRYEWLPHSRECTKSLYTLFYLIFPSLSRGAQSMERLTISRSKREWCGHAHLMLKLMCLITRLSVYYRYAGTGSTFKIANFKL